MADFVAIGLRAAAIAAALFAAGTPIFLWLFEGKLARSTAAIRTLAIRVTLSALALTAAYALAEPARLVGELSGILDGSLQMLLLASDFGKANGIRVLGLAMILAAMLLPTDSRDRFALPGAVLVAISFAMMGHTTEVDQRALLVPLLVAHLLVVAFWFGSLWPLLLITRLEGAAVVGGIVERFSRIAVKVVPFVLVTGIVMAGLLLPEWSSLVTTSYGIALVLKLAGFAMLMVLASLNKWRFAPCLARGDRSATAAFRISILVEWALVVVVVAVAAAMTALFSPEH